MPRHMTVFPGGESLEREVPAELCNFFEIARKRQLLAGSFAVFYQAVEEINFRRRQCYRGVTFCHYE